MKRIACAALLVTAALLLTASGSQGATVAYSFTTNTGYTGAGELSYDAATAPLVIIESGSGQTTSLRSLSLAIFSPSSALLDSGSAVIESVSSSPYLGFTYDIATLALSLMDNNTTSSGNDVSYFVSNYVVAAVVEPHLTEPGVARLEHSLLQQAVAVKRDVVGGESNCSIHRFVATSRFMAHGNPEASRRWPVPTCGRRFVHTWRARAGNRWDR